MADINIHRSHSLGLAKARKVAWEWAEQVEAKFDMACTVIEGETSDTVEFTRSGVNGRLVVAPDHFDLHARLGFLLGAFARTIESEIQKNLDDLLGSAAAGGKAKPKATPAAKSAQAETAEKAPAKKAARKAAKKQA
jgi:putative polyhydroxyalkanoate system protein